MNRRTNGLSLYAWICESGYLQKQGIRIHIVRASTGTMDWFRVQGFDPTGDARVELFGETQRVPKADMERALEGVAHSQRAAMWHAYEQWTNTEKQKVLERARRIAAERAETEERRREEECLAAIRRDKEAAARELERLAEQAVSDAIPCVQVHSYQAQQEDKELCRIWTDVPWNDERWRPVMAKNLSARFAERVVAGFFTKLGSHVEDVSVLQLSGQDDRWRRFDLLVDGQPVDVKNARRARSAPDIYSEYTVPRFKRDCDFSGS